MTIPVTSTATPWAVDTDFPIVNAQDEISLSDFILSTYTGDGSTLVGIYISGVLALPIGQQPTDNAGFVTREPDKATQFSLASKFGTVGLLAHNDLAGAKFSNTKVDQFAILVYGDGRAAYYTIQEIVKYQAISPNSPYSEFLDLNGNQAHITSSELFNRVYAPGDRLVLQTCIAGNGNPSWGRLFIIATPASQQVLSVVEQTSRLFEFASFGLVAY